MSAGCVMGVAQGKDIDGAAISKLLSVLTPNRDCCCLCFLSYYNYTIPWYLSKHCTLHTLPCAGISIPRDTGSLSELNHLMCPPPHRERAWQELSICRQLWLDSLLCLPLIRFIGLYGTKAKEQFWVWTGLILENDDDEFILLMCYVCVVLLDLCFEHFSRI